MGAMADAKECPLCGTPMVLTTRRLADRLPGSHESKIRETAEWVCPECDHYEDAGDEDRE
jgi:hypothetical protein